MRSSSKLGRQRAGQHRGARRLAGALFAALALAGCESVPSVTAFEAVTDPERLFMSLTLNHRAINLSTAEPYDTLQLVATPRNGLGEPMDGLPAPTFRSSDTTRVWVTPDGLLEAREVGTRVSVVTEILTEDNIRRADTAWVNVTADATPPEVATFSIAPESPEEAVWFVKPQATAVAAVVLRMAGIDVDQSIPLRVFDASGAPIPGLQIEYESLDPEIARVSPNFGFITGPYAPGEVRIVARTLAYGVAKVDTARFTVTLPAYHLVALQEDFFTRKITFGPADVTIRQDGYVFWANYLDAPMDVTFEDPTNVAEMPQVCATWGGTLCGAGDIDAFTSSLGQFGTFAGRRFPEPGVYEYESTLTGYSGRVVVVAADSTS